MLTRIICASALVTFAGAASYAQHAASAAGVFEWQPRNADRTASQGSGTIRRVSEDDQNSRSMTTDRDADTVVVTSPSSKGGARVSFTDGVKVVELRIDGQRIADLDVTVDGEPLTANARIENGRVTILSPDGKTIAEFSMPAGEGAQKEITWHAQPAQENARGVIRARANAEPGESRAVRVNATPRRVIGITASTPGEALAAQLGVQPDKVILVESVNEGMPAARAGMQRFDIITKVEGSGPANLARLTEILQAKDPAEPIRLTILRGGKEQTIDIRPVVQAEEIEVSVEFNENSMPFGENVFQRRVQGNQIRADEALAMAREALAAQQARLRDLQIHLEQRMHSVGQNLKQKLTDEQVTEEVRRAYQQALQEIREVDVQAQLERALAEVQRAVREVDVRNELRSLPEIRFFQSGQANGKGVVVAPTPPAPPAATSPAGTLRRSPAATPASPASSDDDGRLRSLEERMARIEALLERIASNQNR